MNDDDFLERLAASLNQGASVKTVFGEPIQAGDKVIIPVARVMLGMGGGYGHGVQQSKKLLPTDPSQTVSSGKPETPAEGAGGGGGMYVMAKGVYEVTSKTTRFIPARDVRQLLIVLTAGFLLGRLFTPRLTGNEPDKHGRGYRADFVGIISGDRYGKK